MTHRLDELIRHLEDLIDFDLEARHERVNVVEDGIMYSLQPWERKEDRDNLRSYIAGLRVLRRERNRETQIWNITAYPDGTVEHDTTAARCPSPYRRAIGGCC